ncbi:carbonic anhydrase [Mariannaea sp. PMI_226]|nr:carbonic anhydrase [Mariannaea sp. PMI_226]
MILNRVPISSFSSLSSPSSFSRLSSSNLIPSIARQTRLSSPHSPTSILSRISYHHNNLSPSSPRYCSSSSKHHPPTPPDLRTMAEKDIKKYLEQSHDRIFENNRRWAAEKKEKNPDFFAHLSAGQNPEYLWIGCADSRIPAEQITGLEPGEAFIHRNIANLVCNTDLNVMSVINYAVNHLGVKHIVVCGHYGCGGVKAAMTPQDLGILNPWLRNIRDVYRLHEKELDAISDQETRYRRLVELNVIEQCRNVIKSADVQKSYAKNKFPIVHGWVFGFNDGLLKDLDIDFEAVLRDIQKIYNLVD